MQYLWIEYNAIVSHDILLIVWVTDVHYVGSGPIKNLATADEENLKMPLVTLLGRSAYSIISYFCFIASYFTMGSASTRVVQSH